MFLLIKNIFLILIDIADKAIKISNYDNFDIVQMSVKLRDGNLSTISIKKISILGNLDKAENCPPLIISRVEKQSRSLVAMVTGPKSKVGWI